MDTKELQRKVNEGLKDEGKPTIDDLDFLTAISSLVLKGLIIQMGDEIYSNNIT